MSNFLSILYLTLDTTFRKVSKMYLDTNSKKVSVSYLDTIFKVSLPSLVISSRNLSSNLVPSNNKKLLKCKLLLLKNAVNKPSHVYFCFWSGEKMADVLDFPAFHYFIGS